MNHHVVGFDGVGPWLVGLLRLGERGRERAHAWGGLRTTVDERRGGVEDLRCKTWVENRFMVVFYTCLFVQPYFGMILPTDPSIYSIVSPKPPTR